MKKQHDNFIRAGNHTKRKSQMTSKSNGYLYYRYYQYSYVGTLLCIKKIRISKKGTTNTALMYCKYIDSDIIHYKNIFLHKPEKQTRETG